MEFLHEFHNKAFLPKAITASFLVLVPKKDHLQSLTDYRPICLVSSLYKILSKVLADRLKKVLGKVISKLQSAFIPNRQILDGVLVVNELLDLAKRRKDKCLFFKVDFERAYDTVNWNFLDYMLGRMGFAGEWRSWIRACIFQSSMSVLVNGSPTEDFVVGKGLRQGDPLSPFLFLIVAEGLTGLMCKAVDNSSFLGYKVSNDISFHTLQFVDDTIIVGEGNWENLWSIKTVLRSFEIVSGANPRRRTTWTPIIDSMKKRLCSWNGRHLSIGGRVTLIKSEAKGKAIGLVIISVANLEMEKVISDMGNWDVDFWRWNLLWSEELNVSELVSVRELQAIIEQ
ncbi:LINE-1 reverse transcriptase like, partial [Trifolium medium]|nr:LINE-1 reverse transcriptase like [Trifolium medium]